MSFSLRSGEPPPHLEQAPLSFICDVVGFVPELPQPPDPSSKAQIRSNLPLQPTNQKLPRVSLDLVSLCAMSAAMSSPHQQNCLRVLSSQPVTSAKAAQSIFQEFPIQK